MGEVVSSTCICGYEAEAVIGAGRLDFKEVCKFPHYCDSCNQVTSIDIFKTKRTCNNCKSQAVHSYEANTKRVPYEFLEKISDETLKKYGYHKRHHEYTSWCGKEKSHVILHGTHHCPSCKKNTLQFKIKLMFD
jgi:hypothetical protein